MARMLYRNIGMNRDERIQNTFTRYLTCALDRENARFRYKQRQEQKMQPYDETGDEPASGELLAALADRQVTQASNPRSWQDFLQQVDAGWLYKALHALKIILQLGNSVKELRVYPAMWKKPEEPECIFVSDSCLKYAKPYAIQQITNFL